MTARRHVALGVLALAVVAGTLAGPAAAAEDTRLVHDGDRLVVEAATAQAVVGETDLSAGTTLSVRIRSAEADQPFLKTATATVTADGTFRARFDFSGVSPGATFDATVSHDGSRLASAAGEVVCAGCTTPRDRTPADRAATTDGADGPPNTTVIDDPAPGVFTPLLGVLALGGLLGVVGIAVLVGVIEV